MSTEIGIPKRCFRCAKVKHHCRPADPKLNAYANDVVRACEAIADRPDDADEAHVARTDQALQSAVITLSKKLVAIQHAREAAVGVIPTPGKRKAGGAQGSSDVGLETAKLKELHGIRLGVEAIGTHFNSFLHGINAVSTVLRYPCESHANPLLDGHNSQSGRLFWRFRWPLASRPRSLYFSLSLRRRRACVPLGGSRKEEKKSGCR